MQGGSTLDSALGNWTVSKELCWGIETVHWGSEAACEAVVVWSVKGRGGEVQQPQLTLIRSLWALAFTTAIWKGWGYVGTLYIWAQCRIRSAKQRYSPPDCLHAVENSEGRHGCSRCPSLPFYQPDQLSLPNELCTATDCPGKSAAWVQWIHETHGKASPCNRLLGSEANMHL